MNTPVYREMVRLLNNKMNRSFWDQLFLYIKDGWYCIDRSALPLGSSKNSLAERTLRPMTVERKRSISDRLLPKGRKNSLTFGSHAGAKVSVIYHTFIETCKMCGVSTLEYLRNSSRLRLSESSSKCICELPSVSSFGFYPRQLCREEQIMRICYR